MRLESLCTKLFAIDVRQKIELFVKWSFIIIISLYRFDIHEAY